MNIRMNTIIAIMITFCFTATLFMVIPIRSATSPYDPWIDYNDDGKIGLSDLVILANSYGTTGTPINKTAVLLELQSKLNELEARVAALEAPIGLIITTLTNKTVMKLDLDGNVFWNVNIDSITLEACWNPTDGSVYVLSSNNLTRLYSNGTIMWNIDISSMIVPGVGGPWTIDIDPNDGSVYLVAGGGLGSPFGLYKYDSNGTFLWYIPCGSNDVQSVVVNPTDGSVYTQGYETGVFKYYPNGTMIWHTPIPGGYQNPYGSYSIAVDPSDGSVVALMRFGGPATKIDANGNIVWTTFFTSDKSRVEIDPYRISVYVKGDGYLHKICLTNGNVSWGRSIPSGSSSNSANTIATNYRDGSVYFGGYDCNLTRVDPYDGSTIWSRSLGYIVGDITFECRFVPFD